METITLTGRNSRLSLLQIEIVKQKIEAAFPEIEVMVKPRSTRGDELQNIPLQTVEGTDFFTADIFESLESGEADIAVHSLKDMSTQHFFGNNFFAVVDRDDVRDVAIFQKDILSKIALGKNIIIGTCSPRREQMAVHFLQQALPQLHSQFKVETKIIRGNVDTRLKKLNEGEYDGIILAAAGLNRLLRSSIDSTKVRALLQDKRLMILPLLECVPAPCQGAIVAETTPLNRKAVAILEKINNEVLLQQCIKEKKIAIQYGAGCDQKFGVTTVEYGDQKIIYAAGASTKGNIFENWFGLPQLNADDKIIFAVSEINEQLFRWEVVSTKNKIEHPVVFVSHHKSIQENLTVELQSKRVWVAGSKTWLKLAKKGIWVEGCADGLGLESVKKTWCSPLVNIHQKSVLILTNESAAANWSMRGWNTQSTYKIFTRENRTLEKIQSADIIFWTSIRQYQLLHPYIKREAIHVCPFGETAVQLKVFGINPVIFPTIKAFQQWKNHILLPIAG